MCFLDVVSLTNQIADRTFRWPHDSPRRWQHCTIVECLFIWRVVTECHVKE